MPPISGLSIQPPLLNSSCPWASSFEQLEELYKCESTGAVTTRTSTMDGFAERPDTHTVAFARDQTASLNSYGYSPHSLATYLTWIGELFKKGDNYSRSKPIILSIAPADPAQLGQMVEAIQAFRRSIMETTQVHYHPGSEESPSYTDRVLAVELNTSCPNIPGHPPPSYDLPTLVPLLRVFADAYRSDPTLVLGLKLAPYVYRAQMEAVVEAIADLTDEQGGGNPIAFLTCTNTLGGCVMFADQAKTPEGLVSQNTNSAMALPTTFGGLAGEPLHCLSLGNVMTISSLLSSSTIPAIQRIGIIGVGGVASPAAYKRMREAGAVAVACATALGLHGVGIFEKLLVKEDKGSPA